MHEIHRVCGGPFGGVLVAIALVCAGVGCRPSTISTSESATSSSSSPGDGGQYAEMAPKVVAFCGDCHATPSPDTFPRDAWPKEVQQGYNFYAESGRHDLEVPPLNQVVAYYRALAPAEWPTIEPPAHSPGPIRFEPTQLAFSGEQFPAISHLVFEETPSNEKPNPGVRSLLWCDMREGVIARTPTKATPLRADIRARIPHPAHITRSDLDSDNRPDYLVADLGTYLPEDHRDGRVVWLRPHANGTTYETFNILKDVGRVADVQVADFNEDGRQDLVVAEFGWRQTGQLRILWGEGDPSSGDAPSFRDEAIDPRHGIIHVPIADINNDGRPDIIALVSQEHECIDAFINQGGGKFERRQLFQADDPSFGSSGIELSDIDGDGDLDIVYTNGDMMDSFYLKPYHAVHWLENKGDLTFQDHVLTNMPGVYRAVAGDLDGDGDMDIAACAYITRNRTRGGEASAYDTIIWLEQVSPGKFERHSVERSPRGHMAMILADTDEDGDLDIVAGSYGHQPEENPSWITIWRNQGASP